MIDHGPNVALTHAYLWAVAVRAQVQRVVEGNGSPQRTPDAFLLVIAARNVRRAACMALAHLTGTGAREQLREALDHFDTTLPDLEDARNVLEHFDEYTRGVGHRQQRPTIKPGQRAADEPLAQQYRVGFEHVGDDPRRRRIRIGPHAIELTEAGRAASQLVQEIRAAR